MLRLACIEDHSRVLEIGTGSGYETPLLAQRFGDKNLTSVDIDRYLISIGAERLEYLGLRPRLIAQDANGVLPGQFDRLVATTSVRPIQPSWLQALNPRGRLVAVIANTSLLITADKTPDGGAAGQIEYWAASFMASRSGGDYPPSR